MTERVHASGVVFSDDPSRLDFDVVHGALARSYWSPGVPRDVVERAARGSMAFGLYAPTSPDASREVQVGYARAVTDRATVAYLTDVVVLEPHRGRGLGAWMMRQILAHPELQGLRRWLLTTQDAHAFYERLGFVRNPFPERFMVVDRPSPYADA